LEKTARSERASRNEAHNSAMEDLMQQPRALRPRRVQLRRTRGWRTPANTVKVDRTTRFGNPFSIEDYGRERAIALHRAWIAGEVGNPPIPSKRVRELEVRRTEVIAALPSLRGKNLACWCPLPEPGERDICHAVLLLELANPWELAHARWSCEPAEHGSTWQSS
jgi:Domain of unknown function (DUF4326)